MIPIQRILRGVCALWLIGAVSAGGSVMAQSEGTVTSTKIIAKTIKKDTNADGTPDRIEIYDAGMLVRTEADSNFDGEMDEWVTYVNGRMSKVEQDTDFDGKIDTWADV